MPVRQRPASRDDVRTRIVAAAAGLLREQGAAAVTTRAVADAAGVQAPTLYRLFGDKDGLVDAVAEHVMAAYVEEKGVVAAHAADPVLDLREGWRTHVAFGLAHAELYALLSAPGRAEVSPATAAGVAVLRERVRRVAAAGLLRVEEERAVMMVHAAGTGTVLALLGRPAAQRDLRLADDMLDAVLGRVLVDAPPPPDATATAVVVAFATAVPTLPGLTPAERGVLAEWVDRVLVGLRDD